MKEINRQMIQFKKSRQPLTDFWEQNNFKVTAFVNYHIFYPLLEIEVVKGDDRLIFSSHNYKAHYNNGQYFSDNILWTFLFRTFELIDQDIQAGIKSHMPYKIIKCSLFEASDPELVEVLRDVSKESWQIYYFEMDLPLPSKN